MARMYKTASANPLDYMYRMNVPLMQQVISANDDYITQNLNQASQLNTLASTFPYLQPDEQRAKAITDEYSAKIDEITKAIKADPANWRKQQDPIRNLSRDLQSNYRTGEISKIADNYGKYKKTSDYIDSQVQEYGKSGKGISADRAKAYKQHFLSSFTKANPNGTAYDASTGNYNSINVFDPMGNIDIRKQLSEELEKMKSDGEIKITDEVTGSGEYFNKQTSKWEGITPEKILRIASGRLNNPQIMDYLKQDSQVGIISGVFDDQTGKFIAPYNYNKVDFSSGEQKAIDDMTKEIAATKNPNTQAQMQSQLNEYKARLEQRKELQWNNQSYLAPILRGITDEFSYSKTEESNDLTANSIWSTKFSQSQANARNNASIAATNARQEKAFAQQDKVYDKTVADRRIDKLIDFSFDLANPKNYKSAKAGTTSATGTKTVTDKSGKPIGTINAAVINPDKTNTDNAVIGQSYVTPFAWTATDKTKMTTTLNDEINIHTNSIKSLETTLADMKKNHPENKVLIASAENQIANKKAQLQTLEGQRNVSIDYAINQWKSKGTYNEGSEQVVRELMSGKLKNNFDAANAAFQKIEAQRLKMDVNSPDYNLFLKTTYYPVRTRKANAEALYNGGQRIFNSEVKPYSDEKLQRAAQETTYSSNIIQTTKAQDDVIFTMVNASPSNYKIVDSRGRETGLSFEHGTVNTDRSKFKITGVNTSTGLGDKSVEITAIVNGRPVIIIPKDDGGKMQGYFATEFKKSKNKEVAGTGAILSSPTASVISDMDKTLRMNTGSTFGDKSDTWVYRTIPNPANPSETIRIRSRHISVDEKQGQPKIEVQWETGDEGIYFKNKSGNKQTKGVDYDVDANGKLRGFVPLASTKSPNGIYHNLEDIISIFPSGN